MQAALCPALYGGPALAQVESSSSASLVERSRQRCNPGSSGRCSPFLFCSCPCLIDLFCVFSASPSLLRSIFSLLLRIAMELEIGLGDPWPLSAAAINNYHFIRRRRPARRSKIELRHQERMKGRRVHQELMEDSRASRRSTPTTRRSRSTNFHIFLERRRRDRINEKLKALQEITPSATPDIHKLLEEHWLMTQGTQLQNFV